MVFDVNEDVFNGDELLNGLWACIHGVGAQMKC